MKPLRRPARLFALLLAAGAISARAAPAPTEVQLKAAFIFHFTQFVDWPAQAFAAPDAPFIIGVLGDDSMVEALTAMVRDEKLAGHSLEVRRLRSPSEAAACQILYVSSDDEDLFRDARLRGAPVLTVGETDSFLQWGGVIEFFTDHNHVRLRINLASARGSSLQISSKLLRVAQILSP
jgi:YfiR/HmsC-like